MTTSRTGEQRYDVILDIGGNSSLSRLRRALAPKGTLVIAGGETGGRWLGGYDRQLRALMLSPFVGQKLTTFVSRENHEDMLVLKELIEAGKITPVIDRTYPLSEAPEAIRYLERGTRPRKGRHHRLTRGPPFTSTTVGQGDQAFPKLRPRSKRASDEFAPPERSNRVGQMREVAEWRPTSCSGSGWQWVVLVSRRSRASRPRARRRGCHVAGRRRLRRDLVSGLKGELR